MAGSTWKPVRPNPTPNGGWTNLFPGKCIPSVRGPEQPEEFATVS
jgi:hypothetical protein